MKAMPGVFSKDEQSDGRSMMVYLDEVVSHIFFISFRFLSLSSGGPRTRLIIAKVRALERLCFVIRRDVCRLTKVILYTRIYVMFTIIIGTLWNTLK